jgi:hypothetical protein
MLLETGAFTPGATVDFRLHLSSGEAPIAGREGVVRLTEGGRPALAFEQVHVADHERLTRYIAAARGDAPSDPQSQPQPLAADDARGTGSEDPVLRQAGQPERREPDQHIRVGREQPTRRQVQPQRITLVDEPG